MEGRRTGIGKGDTDKVSLPRSYYGTRARKESGGGEGNERRRESYPCTIDIRLRFRFYTRLTCYTDGWMDGWMESVLFASISIVFFMAAYIR